jgi:hypothetical protein
MNGTLAENGGPITHRIMSTAQLIQNALELPEIERLELARKLVESLALGEEARRLVEEGVRRIEDVATGRTPGLSDGAFRQALR